MFATVERLRALLYGNQASFLARLPNFELRLQFLEALLSDAGYDPPYTLHHWRLNLTATTL